MDELLLAVDHGSFNSVLATIDAQGKPVAIAVPEGGVLVPSKAFLTDRERLFGLPAVAAAALSPACFAEEWKREMGNPGAVFTDGAGKEHSAEDLAAMFFAYLKSAAEQSTGRKARRAVVAVPSDADSNFRQATVRAGKRAGFEAIDLVNEPTAAAIGFGLAKGDRRFAVSDLGHGTYDFTILEVKGGVVQVLGTAGDRALGSRDFEDLMARKVVGAFRAKHGTALSPADHPGPWFEMRDKVRRAKEALSGIGRAGVIAGLDGKSVSVEFLREDYEKDIAPFADRMVDVCRKSLAAAGLKWTDLDCVVPVGGPMRTPFLRQRIQAECGLPLRTDVDADQAVALGAAEYAWTLATQRDGGIRVGGKVLRAPVAEVRDVTAHDLGCLVFDVDKKEVRATVIIRAQTKLPAKERQTFPLEEDEQTEARVVVVQGKEGDPPDRCVIIGELVLKGLPAVTPRTPRIRVEYAYDIAGIVHVTATDEVSGRSASTDLQWSCGKA